MMNIDKFYEVMSRRQIIHRFSRLAMFTSLSVFLGDHLFQMASANDADSPKRIFAYGDEGRWPTQTSFTIGFLVTSQPDMHRLKLKELRKKHNYWKTFQYDSTDRFKVPYGTDVLKYFFEHDDLKYVAKIAGVSKTSESFHYKSLVSQLSPRQATISLSLKTNSRLDGGKRIRSYIKRELVRVGEITVVRGREDDLMQLADFITGNVALDASYAQGDELASKNEVKVKLLNTMREHLKVSSLIHESLNKGNKFRVLRG